MTVTSNPNESALVPVARILQKKSGRIIWIIRSEANGSASKSRMYKTVWYYNKVVGCEGVDGLPCKGWAYRRKCHHATLVQQFEEARMHPAQKRKEEQEEVTLPDWVGMCQKCHHMAHFESAVPSDYLCDMCKPHYQPSESGALHGSKAFSLLK